jgi:hypothetical protein
MIGSKTMYIGTHVLNTPLWCGLHLSSQPQRYEVTTHHLYEYLVVSQWSEATSFHAMYLTTVEKIANSEDLRSCCPPYQLRYLFNAQSQRVDFQDVDRAQDVVNFESFA